MGGSDDPSNLISLTVEEHAEAHRLLYEQYGLWQDYVAWQGLAKLISKEELVRIIQSNAGKKVRELYPNPFAGIRTGNNFALSNKNREIASELAKTENAISKKKSTYRKINHQQGSNNSQFGKVWCIEASSSSLEDRKKFNKDQIPKNWISTLEWKDNRKNKGSNAYGRHWYNNGRDNFYLYEDNTDIIEFGLIMGRLKQRKPA